MVNVYIDSLNRVEIPEKGTYFLVKTEEIYQVLIRTELSQRAIWPDDGAVFGIVLRVFRSLKGLSQKELADASNVEACTISQYESEKKKRVPHQATIESLSKILGDTFFETVKSFQVDVSSKNVA